MIYDENLIWETIQFQIGIFRYFSYMLIHESPSHLWYNMLTQFTMAWFAMFRHYGLIGHFELLLVYLLSGFSGGFAFKIIENSTNQVNLVGASAGVFGIAGLCLWDSIAEMIEFCLIRCGLQDKASSYYDLNQSTFGLSFVAKKRLMFFARTSAVIVLVAFDAYAFTTGDNAKRVTVLVHASGFACGVMLGLALFLFHTSARRIVALGKSYSVRQANNS